MNPTEDALRAALSEQARVVARSAAELATLDWRTASFEKLMQRFQEALVHLDNMTTIMNCVGRFATQARPRDVPDWLADVLKNTNKPSNKGKD